MVFEGIWNNDIFFGKGRLLDVRFDTNVIFEGKWFDGATLFNGQLSVKEMFEAQEVSISNFNLI